MIVSGTALTIKEGSTTIHKMTLLLSSATLYFGIYYDISYSDVIVAGLVTS